jgi:SHS2 domain-containing protein
MMRYRLLDHTADLAIQVFGTDLKALFANAAAAMFEQIFDTSTVEAREQTGIEVTGTDWPDLMVNWLKELLFLWNGRQMLVKTTHILSLKEYNLSAKVISDPYDPDRHAIDSEIKAVTYHQIAVKRGPRGWESKIVFDV